MGDVPLPLTRGSSTSTLQIITIQSDNSPLPINVTLIENYALWSQGIFQEIDHLSSIRLHCTVDLTKRQTELDRLHAHLFLAGFDLEFDQVRGEILRKDPKLDLDQTFAYVRTDSQQRMTMTGAQEASVMVAQRQKGSQASTGTLIGGTTLKLHAGIGANHSTNLVSPVVPATPAQASASIATTGATDHMTFDPRQITSHTSSPQSVVSNANDILGSKTIGCGTKRDKIYYLDLAPDHEAKVGQAFNMGGS
ncbi:unnamed protein product [Prunus armeniaca]